MQQVNSRKSTIVSMIILSAMFFIFGFVSWVNSILIPYFRISCELTQFQSYFVTFAFYIAYFVMSVPSGMMLEKVGFKKGIMFGFWMMALGMFTFVPAALVREFWVFLIGLFMIGTGLAVLQTAANPYVTIIGPIDSAARRISIVGVCNKLAGIISPLVFAAVILKSSDSETFALVQSGVLDEVSKNAILDELIRRVIWPYAILGIGLFLFGILIRYSILPELDTKEANSSDEAQGENERSIFSYPYLVLGALALFCHVGTQVVAIDTLIPYAESMGLDMLEAKVFPSYTLACTLLGYLIGIVLIPKYLSQTKALIICTVTGLVLSLCCVLIDFPICFMGHNITTSLLFLNLMGLPNALIYAGIWPLAIRGLGSHTKRGSSILIMMLCGNALMPQLYSLVAGEASLKLGYWVLVPCFMYLVFYAVKGHKIEKW